MVIISILSQTGKDSRNLASPLIRVEGGIPLLSSALFMSIPKYVYICCERLLQTYIQKNLLSFHIHFNCFSQTNNMIISIANFIEYHPITHRWFTVIYRLKQIFLFFYPVYQMHSSWLLYRKLYFFSTSGDYCRWRWYRMKNQSLKHARHKTP